MNVVSSPFDHVVAPAAPAETKLAAKTTAAVRDAAVRTCLAIHPSPTAASPRRSKLEGSGTAAVGGATRWSCANWAGAPPLNESSRSFVIVLMSVKLSTHAPPPRHLINPSTR